MSDEKKCAFFLLLRLKIWWLVLAGMSSSTPYRKTQSHDIYIQHEARTRWKAPQGVRFVCFFSCRPCLIDRFSVLPK